MKSKSHLSSSSVGFKICEFLRRHLTLLIELCEEDSLKSAGRVSDTLLLESIAVCLCMHNGGVDATRIFRSLKENDANCFTAHISVG
jgi:hypothetical protein